MKRFQAIVSFLVLFLALSENIFACSVYVRPTAIHNPKEYVFIGEVLEFTVVPFKNSAGGIGNIYQTPALKVKVIDKVQIPSQTKDYFEVFPLQLDPGCKLWGWKEDKLKEYFPIGTQVRIVASEATIAESKSDEGNIRLETSIFNRGSIGGNYSGASLANDSLVEYFYQNWKETGNTKLSEQKLFYSNRLLPQYEMRKDLLRLETSKSEAQKLAILDRLFYFPDKSLDFSGAVYFYLKDKNKVRELSSKYTETIKSKRALN